MQDVTLKSGAKYTLIHISQTGICFRREFEVISEDQGNYEIKIKDQQARQILFARQVTEALIFKGHDLPLLVDSDTPHFAMNRRFNFVTHSPRLLRVFIVEQCLNLSDEKKARIWYRGFEPADEESQPLFNEGQPE
jgi:hypothetical protein